MDKAKRYLIPALIILLFSGLSLPGKSQDRKNTYQYYDQKSLELYNKGDWKELSRLCSEALKDGYDYYYLRIRAGIAGYERERYMTAAMHFEAALGFYTADPVAGEYLFYCYLELNRWPDVYKVYNELPPSLRAKLKEHLPKNVEANMDAGPVFSNQMAVYDTIDLDGPDNIYGETEIIQDGYYFDAGLAWKFKKGYSLYGSYSLVKLNKVKKVQIDNTLSVDDDYPLVQHQLYLNGNIPFGNGFSIIPAFNLVTYNYKVVMPKVSPDSTRFLFPVKNFNENSFIGYLSVNKDFMIVRTSLFLSYSNLNAVNQFQAGFRFTVYPYGNLNFYLGSTLLNNRNDGNNSIIFKQMAGFRLFKPLWAEIDATFGRMDNFHDNQAYVVYNIADRMKFKGGARAILMLSPRWLITADYLYLWREGNYLTYAVQPDESIAPVINQKDFNNQIVLLGITWKI